ncbi:MAG: GGDEF domain-containing protein [Campylobacterota bacterium]|nr:GGDEF domain-containing protein [Campylobacterota bacterium]
MLNKKWKDVVNKLDFAFQPIVNIKTGKLYAVEALLRNVKEAGFYHSIFALFDDAYHDGILYQLDLELRQIAFSKFAKIDIPNIQLFYNLDNRLMYVPDFSYGNTSKILSKLDLNKKQICFELSERGTMQDPSAVTNMVNRYKQEGFDIAIDDFGTGIAGFQLLYYAEATFIKLDRFFIDNIHNDSKKRIFCSSIVNMAHIMGIKVIAEGIETKEEYYTCKDIGADLLQGYFIQKPKIDIDKIKSQYDDIKELYKKDKRHNSSNLIDEKKIEKILPLSIDTNLEDLFLYFKKNPTNSFVPIVDSVKQLCGVIYEEDIKQFSYSPFGVSLAKNDKTNEKLKTYIKEAISVEVTWGVDKVLEVYNMYQEDSKGIFVTKNNQYYGFINVNNLLSLSYNRNIEIASDQNPLTKLAGNKKIEQFLYNAFKHKKKDIFHIVYFDFNDFKPFNDMYGFRQGDRAILIFADILKKELSNDTFIAHIGGDDFFVGFKNKDYMEVYNAINTIQQQFKTNVKELYSKDDKQNGYIQTKDRFGVERKFKLLGVASAIVEISKKTNKNNFDLALGSIKKDSKKIDIPLATTIL